MTEIEVQIAAWCRIVRSLVFVKGGVMQTGKSPKNQTYTKPDQEEPFVGVNDMFVSSILCTQEDYEDLMGINPSSNKKKQGTPYQKSLPVDNVNWYDSMAVVTKLNELAKFVYVYPEMQEACEAIGAVLGRGLKFDLTLKEEWEYASKGGQETKHYIYSGSNEYDEVANQSTDADPTFPVRSKKPNELGIYGMTGNTWEWNANGYDKEYEDRCRKFQEPGFYIDVPDKDIEKAKKENIINADEFEIVYVDEKLVPHHTGIKFKDFDQKRAREYEFNKCTNIHKALKDNVGVEVEIVDHSFTESRKEEFIKYQPSVEKN